jgi:hypothetical protein
MIIICAWLLSGVNYLYKRLSPWLDVYILVSMGVDIFFRMLSYPLEYMEFPPKERTTKLKRGSYSKQRYLRAFQVLAVTITLENSIESYGMDTDSTAIGMDNRCSACISAYKEDFIGPLHETGRKVKGFGGTLTGGASIGTLK